MWIGLERISRHIKEIEKFYIKVFKRHKRKMVDLQKLIDYGAFLTQFATVVVLIQDVCGAERLGAVFERGHEFHPGSVQAPWGHVAGCQEEVAADEDAAAHPKGLLKSTSFPA